MKYNSVKIREISTADECADIIDYIMIDDRNYTKTGKLLKAARLKVKALERRRNSLDGFSMPQFLNENRWMM